MAYRTMSFVSILVGQLWVSVALAAGPFGVIQVGNWTGGAYTNGASGAFSHCGAEALYDSGNRLLVGKDLSGTWMLGFAYAPWPLDPGETFSIDITFGGHKKAHLSGTAVLDILANVALPNKASLGLFRKSRSMVVEAKGQTVKFNLTFTSRVLSKISNCVAEIKSGAATIAEVSSVPFPKPRMASTQKRHPELQAMTQSTAAVSLVPALPSKPIKTISVSGTGFAISTDGYILTNYHVISGCVGDIYGTLTNEVAMILRIVSKDEVNDLALLQAPTNFKDTVTIRGTAIRPGDAVIAIGYPYHGLLRSEFTVTTGVISSLSGILNDTRYVQISAPVQPGNSGGPLLDDSGELVGVVAEKFNALRFSKIFGDVPENMNFAIKTGAVRDFLDNSFVAYKTAEPGPELKNAEIADRARAYTMLISCTANEKEE